ncbi:GABBR2 [Symbiodinium natans]|uniref:GABBR2 protein n=1 Tax=Symbiodinium natans TaxID=878477 RepID=A0A812P4Y2_9DINO|nr:GABBR2 [Symbiodinium natans]
MAEPLLALAAQEIEDSNYLPGYRINLHLTDSGCDEAIATEATIEALTRGPRKHAILGDSCSQACAAVSDAARLFKVLQISPGCDSPSLSDRQRYPYFARMAPSDRFKVTAIYEVFKMFSWKRVGVMDGPIYTIGAKEFFLELVQRDLDAGTYNWTVLLDRRVNSLADAQSAADEVKARDSRINMMVLPEYIGMWVLCQFYLRDMLPPHYVWFIAVFGNWVNNITAIMAGTPECPCTADQLARVSGGLMVSGRSPIQSTSELHGLSGTRLSDIWNFYNTQCQAFANGLGACDYLWTGYFYDGLWHLASLLHTYLVEQNHSLSELGTIASRAALYELSLGKDYVGLTGRVRQFNSIEPTTVPPSFGDRDGVQLLRQITGGPGNEFTELAQRTTAGILWLADLVWSPYDSKSVPCSNGTCALEAAWVPSDRIAQCPAGTVFSVQLGCVACEKGRSAAAGKLECEPCNVGTFANVSGLGACHPCATGTFNNVLGADGCELCSQGFSANETESTSCTKCPIGRYAAQKGLAECEECPPGRTTTFSGAVDIEACQCQGELFQGECIVCSGNTRYESGQCLQCLEGLTCNGGRTAVVQSGYFTSSSAPFDVYKCLPVEFCPGGLPGTCYGGRVGVPCTQCPAGQAWDTNACAECTSLGLAGWLAGATVGVIAVPALYYMMNMRQSAKATTMLATSCALAMTISMLQNVGIVGYISFTWPSQLQWMFDLLSIFTLDLQAVGFDCVSSSPVAGYHLTAIMLPCALVWLIICSFLSRLLPARWRFDNAKLVSTLGQFMQVSFTIYSKIALSPVMCYSHPNGKSGMLEHNGIFCFESAEHTPMFIAGMLVLFGMISFYALAIFATVIAPKRASSGDAWFLAATRFLLFRFRSDSWWYGTFMMPRGLLLSLAIVAAGDNPYVQMLIIVTVMMTYMVVQLMTWPWKLPALNAFDATISFSLILMMAILGAFAPDLSQDTMRQLTNVVIGIIFFLNGMVFLMLGITLSALIRLNVMGGSQESVLLALGPIPQPQVLSEKLSLLSQRIQELGENNLRKLLENLSIYDLRMTAQIMTAVGSEVGEASLLLTQRSQLMSTSSKISASRLKDLPSMSASSEQAQQEMAPADAEDQSRIIADTAPSKSAWL